MRRAYGTGSVYQRSSDGRWVAQVSATLPTGRRYRRTVYAFTQGDAYRLLEYLRSRQRPVTSTHIRRQLRQLGLRVVPCDQCQHTYCLEPLG